MIVDNLLQFFNKYKLVPIEYYENNITDKNLFNVIKKTDNERRFFLDEIYKIKIAHQNNIIAKKQCKKIEDILDRFIKMKETNDIKRTLTEDTFLRSTKSI